VGDRSEGTAVTEASIALSLAHLEGEHLLSLMNELQELISSDAGDASTDPALQRLAPTVYPEDAEASAAFASATREELLDRRSADAALVSRALGAFEGLSDRDGDRDVVIPVSDIDAWVRALNALRLVIASRLGIAEEDALGQDDPRRGIYDWLGYRLEMLIQAADEIDRFGDSDQGTLI
jgi:hypothetical protein